MKRVTVNNKRYVSAWIVWNGLDFKIEAMFLHSKKEAEAIIEGLIDTELGEEYRSILQPVKIFLPEWPKSSDEFFGSYKEKLLKINRIFEEGVDAE